VRRGRRRAGDASSTLLSIRRGAAAPDAAGRDDGRMNTLLQPLVDRPAVAIHVTAMLAAFVLGAVLLLARKGTIDHRRLGWTWVALMAVAAFSAIFIEGGKIPRLVGPFSAIHLLIVVVAVLVPLAIMWARRGNVQAHRKTMTRVYWGACVIAGAFTLLPGRFLGDLVWHHWLGIVA
jgi:uncharacterized membrane protein